MSITRNHKNEKDRVGIAIGLSRDIALLRKLISSLIVSAATL